MKAFAIAVVVVLGGVFSAAAQEPGRLTVAGQGSVEQAPDMATVTLGVETEARTAAAALARNSEAMADVLALLAGQGIEPRDMQTSGLSLSPLWNNRGTANPVITGYMAHNRVTVRVRELAGLGVLLDRAVSAGGNTFQGLTFGLQDSAAAVDEARRRAVADALARAELIAGAAGVALGRIVEITEAGPSQPRPTMLREMAVADAVPIAEGEISLGASVTMVFEISP